MSSTSVSYVAAFEVEQDQARGVGPARVQEVHLASVLRKADGGAGERILLVPAEELAPVRVLGVPQEKIEATFRGGGHGGAHPEFRVSDPADDVAGVLGGELKLAGGEGEAVDVVELGILPVQGDEQRVGEVAALVHDLGLHLVEGGEVAVLFRGRVHGVYPPVLVAALVLEVDDVPVVLRPEADPDAALAIVGNGLEVLELGAPTGPTQTFRTPSFGARKARRLPVGGEARAHPLGVAEQDFAWDQWHGHCFLPAVVTAFQHAAPFGLRFQHAQA